MKIPIPKFTYDGPGVIRGGPPVFRQPQGGGISDIGNALQDIGRDIGRREAIQLADQREAEEVARRAEAEQAKSRNIERASSSRVEWTEKLMQRQQEADPEATNFTGSLLLDFDKWQEESLGAVADKGEREQLKGMLLPLRERMAIGGLQFERDRRVSYRRGVLADGVDADAKVVGADPAQFREVLALRVAAIRSSADLDPAERAQLEDRAKDAIAYSAGRSMADTDPRGFLERTGQRSKGTKGKDGGRAPDAADRVKSDPLLASMSAKSLASLVDYASTRVAQQEAAAAAEAERRQRQAEIAANKKEREASRAFNILHAMQLDGRVINGQSPSVQKAMNDMEGTPYAAAFREGTKDAARRSAAALQPLPTQREQLSGLYAMRNTSGTSPELEDEIKRREQVLNAADQAYRDEPLMALAERGVIPFLPPVDTRSADALISGLPGRVQIASVARQQSGAAASPLTKGEADVLARYLQAVPPDQRGTQIAIMASAVPADQLQALARQIDAKDKPLALAMAAGASATAAGRTVAELILRGAQAVKDKSIKEDMGAEFGVRASIASRVGNAVPEAMRSDVIEAARYIYLGKSAADEKVTFDGAIRLAIGGDIVEHNGQNIPVPTGVDIAAKLQTYPEAEIAQQTADGWVYVTGGRPMGVPEFLAALPTAQLEPVGHGRYRVRSGGGSGGGVVTNDKRQPIVVTVK